jgi:microcystin-dependent protein
MRVRILIVSILLMLSSFVTAQVEVSVGSPNSDASSILDLKSDDKGFLIPRLSTPLREAIDSPGRSLLVFDTTEGKFYFYDGGQWYSLNELVRTADSNNINLPSGNLSIGGNISASGDVSTSNLSISGFSTNALVPTGVIFMWSGSIASIPPGWALCDGSNGTPDLRERFIVGAGSGDNAAVTETMAYSPGTNDGLNSVTLAANQTGLVSHIHSITDLGHNHGINNGTSRFATWINNEADAGSGSSGHEVSPTVHPFTVDNSTTGVTINSVASSTALQSHENRPPYFALAFIMKLP